MKMLGLPRIENGLCPEARPAGLPAGDHLLHLGGEITKRPQAGDVDGDQKMAGTAAAVGNIGPGHRRAMPAPRQQPAKNIHHRGKSGAFVPGHGKKRAGDRRRRVGRRIPVGIRRPVIGDGLPRLLRQIGLAAGDGRMGEIQNKGGVETGWRRLALRVVADQLFGSALRWDGRAGIAGKKADHARLGKLAGEEHGGAEMA